MIINFDKQLNIQIMNSGTNQSSQEIIMMEEVKR